MVGPARWCPLLWAAGLAGNISARCAPVLTGAAHPPRPLPCARSDIGCHIDGYIAQAAHSLVVAADAAAPVTGRAADVIACAQTAYEAAARLIRPGVLPWRCGAAAARSAPGLAARPAAAARPCALHTTLPTLPITPYTRPQVQRGGTCAGQDLRGLRLQVSAARRPVCRLRIDAVLGGRRRRRRRACAGGAAAPRRALLTPSFLLPHLPALPCPAAWWMA